MTFTLLDGTRTINNSLNTSNGDFKDRFKFRLGETSNFNLALTNMSADADIRIYRDSNGSRELEDNVDELVVSSLRSGSQDEAINLESLEAGNYFVQVRAFGEIATNYQLRMSTEDPSNFLPTEIEVGALTGSKTFNGSVGSDNTADTYRFNLISAGNLELSLYGLSADADVRVVHDSNNNDLIDFGEVIATSTNAGTSTETINLTGLDAGDYLVQVYQYSGATNYTLDLYTPALYHFTYQYGDGEYYKGYGYTQPGEEIAAGERIYQSSANETGHIGYYDINSATPITNHLSFAGQVVVNEYYDLETGYIADDNIMGGTQGHLHDPDYPFDATRDFNVGRGYTGLGSEGGIVHTDGHPSLPGMSGVDTTTFAVFDNSIEADMIPITAMSMSMSAMPM
ncbi:MAG: hypothetical protein F6K36_11380 [Symploca sp. SIO3C6]|nr:hypothetical protein [Symploca sp. SIO3C6]